MNKIFPIVIILLIGYVVGVKFPGPAQQYLGL